MKRPKGETKPTKYWLFTVPEATALQELIYLVKIRWRIERDYQEMKDKLGLDQYEAVAGVVSTITVFFASPPTRSSQPSALGSPLHLLPSSAPLPCPRISRCVALPLLRPERHNPASITTQRLRQARMLVLRLPCCPWPGGVPGTGKL
jgi:hypothetical protein